MKDQVDLLREALDQSLRPGVQFDPVAEVTRVLAAIPNRTLFLDELSVMARRCFLADHAAILSLHRGTGRWFAEATQNLGPIDVKDIEGLSRTVIDQTHHRGTAVLIPDASHHSMTRVSQSIRKHNVQCVMTAPIYVDAELWGLLYLDNTSVPNAFDADSQQQLERFAGFAGIAIRRCQELVEYRVGAAETPAADSQEELFLDFQNHEVLEVMRKLKRAANTEAPILILGETGTGKNVLARWVHENSPRRPKPFREINCAEIDINLIEGELFGIEARVATGVDFREGRIKAADGGTVFLNEIGELPLTSQAKILRAIDERVVERVGGRSPLGVDVRFICATHQPLAELAEHGQFRRDLYHRINIFEVTIPPLRERPEDIPGLAEHLLRRFARALARPGMHFSAGSIEYLQSLPLRANIRELANRIQSAATLSDGDEIELRDPNLPAKHSMPSTAKRATQLKMALRQFETQLIRQCLEQSGWIEARAAARLGVPESTLRSKIKRLGIRKPRRLR
jgi:transcriptional regulator with GAF, ATPase, and Fis domain